MPGVMTGQFLDVTLSGRGAQQGANMLPGLECHQTDCRRPITSRNSGGTVDELPSPPRSSSTPISGGLFARTSVKTQRG